MERCRLCNCVKNREFCGNIFNIKKTDPTIPTIVELFTNLKIVEDDPYTKFICLNCFHILIVFYNYREKILETNQFLQNENEHEQNDVEDFHQNWPRIEYCDDGQFIVYKNDSDDDCKTNFRNGSESADEDNQPLSLLIRVNKKLTDNITGNESNNDELCPTIDSRFDDGDDKAYRDNDDDHDDDKGNQQSKVNTLCTEESLGFIKCEIDIEGTCLKTENDINDDENQKNYENNHEASIPIGDNDDKLIINDNQFSDNKDFDRYCSVFIKDESIIEEGPSINASDSVNEDNQYLSTLIGDNIDTTINDNNNDTLHKISSFNVTGNESVAGSDKNRAHSNNNNNNSVEDNNSMLVLDKQNTGRKFYRCNICGRKNKRRSELKNHLLIHTDEKLHKCDICGKQFTHTTGLKRHLLQHTGEKPYTCHICTKKFTQKVNLIQHLRIHTGEKSRKCNICGKQFTQTSKLKMHLLVHTGEKPYKCDICGKQFTHTTGLKRHLLQHTGEKPHECNICGTKFARKESLETHLRAHTGEKPYTCHICTEKFTQKANLRQHLRIHTGEKSHKCDICGKQFTRGSDFKRHLLKHTGEKPYICDICGKQFTQASNLKIHLLTHTGEKPYKCYICDKKFASKQNLQIHLKVHAVGGNPHV